MKFDNSGNTHPILEWARKIALILLIPALVIFFLSLCLSIWETQREKPSYSYQHSQDSNERIIQYLNCPTITFKDNDVFIGAEIRNLSIKKEINITVSITADNFTFEPNWQGKAPYSFKQSSPNEASSPIWHVIPRETGKKSLTISAVTDNGLSDMVTCQIIIIDLLGVNPSYLYNFTGIIFVLNFILFLQSLQEKENKKRISKQESG